jgi:hypothetical protein
LHVTNFKAVNSITPKERDVFTSGELAAKYTSGDLRVWQDKRKVSMVISAELQKKSSKRYHPWPASQLCYQVLSTATGTAP